MLFFLSMFATLDDHTQVRGGELGGLTTIQEGVRNRRISSADKTGNNNDNVGPIKPGEKWSVDIPGTGIINHIWFTIAPMHIMRNDLIFRIYWDGRSTPSVESPIAAFLEMDGTSIMNMLHSHWQLVLQMGLVWFLISRCLLPMVPV